MLDAHGHAHRHGRARPPQEQGRCLGWSPRGPNQMWSSDITDLRSSVRGVWLELKLMIEVSSAKSWPRISPIGKKGRMPLIS